MNRGFWGKYDKKFRHCCICTLAKFSIFEIENKNFFKKLIPILLKYETVKR